MSENMDLIDTTKYLFDCDFFSDSFDPEDHEDHLECAEKLLSTYPWNDIFYAWNRYLRNNCQTPESVINYCNLFSYYGGQDQFIQDPYDFLGYIFYMVDIDKYWDDAGEFLDGLSISILEKAGKISTVKDPYYQSWHDPEILKAVEKYKKQVT